jgi:2-polyprenyl-3-methyl-5-hydroxy-6-metoxy-1,4-benzoquinol methylase
MSTWEEAQKHEANYWQNCLGMTAWGEFCKQEMYFRCMELFADYGFNPQVGGFDLQGELSLGNRSVLDVGGGPVSGLLRVIGTGRLVVVDPCEWPASVHRRYRNYGIEFIRAPGEELNQVVSDTFDEVWIYNVLQHVQDPALIVKNALSRVAPDGKLRMFEWINIPADACHPHVLTPVGLLNWLRGARIVSMGIPHLKEFWSNADAFVGVFQT